MSNAVERTNQIRGWNKYGSGWENFFLVLIGNSCFKSLCTLPLILIDLYIPFLSIYYCYALSLCLG